MERHNGRHAVGRDDGPDRNIRSRIANACDGCKARKVKCDGKLPCGYCAGRQRPQACRYSPQKQRRRRTAPCQTDGDGDDGDDGAAVAGTANTTATAGTPGGAEARRRRMPPTSAPSAPSAPASAAPTRPRTRQGAEQVADDDTDVPREARLLRDAQGKLVFIGDCAPLSFFQSVRQLVTSRVGQHAFAPESSRYSVLENVPAGHSMRQPRDGSFTSRPDLGGIDLHLMVSSYLSATTGLVDLFHNPTLLDDLIAWANHSPRSDDLVSVVNCLVLAIGSLQQDHEALSQEYFEYARDRALTTLSGNLSVETVQVFILISIYMLCSCQINGAFLFFGIAARAAYSTGIHRTEVNARFGPEMHRQRDRLWKSVRTVDLFMSVSMGRPPSASDVDCTVPYKEVDGDGNEVLDLLNASAQILLITERIVVEVYSRRKISLQLTDGISHQLREWSLRWLQQLKHLISQTDARWHADVSGACQVLTSYYYAVMLVSRPFLMFELVRRLSENPASASRVSGKSKLADACIDAASLMVDAVLDLIERGILTGRAPLIVSWLFAASLVLGVGLLGGFGRILEKNCRMSIQALDHFAKSDGHAIQYSLIAQSLLTTALEHLERRERQDRLRRTESSSQLFGLMPSEPPNRDMETGGLNAEATPSSSSSVMPRRDVSQNYNVRGRGPASRPSWRHESLDRSLLQHQGMLGISPPSVAEMDSAYLGLTDSLMPTPDDPNDWNHFNPGGDGDAGLALNLFPLLEGGGGIDLAHYF